MTDVTTLGQSEVLGHAVADVAVLRERARLGRLRRLAIFLALVVLYLVLRATRGERLAPWPQHNPIPAAYLPGLILVLLLACVIVLPLLGAGRSPHILYRSSEIDVSLSDVKGLGTVVDEVVKTLRAK